MAEFGKLFGIGVGPGDPELMTLKAVRVIKEADVIVSPASSAGKCYAYQIAQKVVPEIDDKVLMFMDFPMIKDEDELSRALDEIFLQIKSELEAGKTVAFLTIGDPTVYSTYMYMHSRAVAAGFEPEIISGTPSFCAVAATLGIPLGTKDTPIHIMPGIYDASDVELSGTRVYMKYGRKLSELKQFLAGEDGIGMKQVYAVSNCGLENQQVYVGLEDIPETSAYFTIVVVV